MSATTAFLSRGYPIGPRYRVLFECPRPIAGQALHMTCEWSPKVPRRLSPQEATAYQVARSLFVEELLQAAGIAGRAAVLEVSYVA